MEAGCYYQLDSVPPEIETIKVIFVVPPSVDDAEFEFCVFENFHELTDWGSYPRSEAAGPSRLTAPSASSRDSAALSRLAGSP